jgi:DNA-binding MarR family transcriptional regulator
LDRARAFLLTLIVVAMFTLPLVPANLSADTQDPRPNNITWRKVDSPIYIDQNNFEIAREETLVIEPGVTVFLGQELGIHVRGKLLAIGTADEPIRFTKIPTQSAPWRSLTFLEDEGSLLDHVVVDMARNGLYILSSSPRVENTLIYGILGSPVVVSSRDGPRSNPVFMNCTLMSPAPLHFEISGDSWVTVVNTSFNEDSTKLGDPDSVLERKWFLDVHVANSLGENVEGSLVSVEDNANGTMHLSRLTNSDGEVRFTVTEYVAHFGFSSENRFYYTPHAISTSKLGYLDVEIGSVWTNASQTINVNLQDRAAPITSLIISGPKYGSDPTYVGEETELSFQVGEGGTFPVQTGYNLDGNGWILYDGQPFVLNGEGSHHISFNSSDPAGNTEVPESRLLFLDTTPPSLSFSTEPAGEGANPISIPPQNAVSLGATDEGSGVCQLTYWVGSGIYKEYSGPLTLGAEGYYNISYTAQDCIGNTAEDLLRLKVSPPPTPHVNNPPYIISTPSEQAKVGDVYYYLAMAFDPEDDDLTYFLVSPPNGMYVNPDTGLLSWTPTEGQVGRNGITLAVSDGEYIDLQGFLIVVETEKAESSDPLLLIFGTIGLFTLVGISLVGSTEYGRFRFFLFFLVPLYSKLRKEEVLNQFLRGQIYGYIMAYPGENYSSIKKALNITNGTLTHHLYILDREGFVTSRVDGRYKRFYPTGLGLSKKMRPKLSMIQNAILKMIRQNPSLSQTEIGEALETSKQVVNYHIKILEKFGVLSVTKHGANSRFRVIRKDGRM